MMYYRRSSCKVALDGARVSNILPGVADELIIIRTEDAYRMAQRLAREEGMQVSPSSAANLVGCVHVADALGGSESAVIVTIFPSPRHDMHVQMGNALADTIVDSDETALGAQPRFDGARHPLHLGKQW